MVVEKKRNYIESRVKVIYGPNRVGDIPYSYDSVKKAKKILNYKFI